MARRSKGTVGVVGLGNMGGAFARHLAAAGWRVLGFDIDVARKRAAARAGVEIAPVETLATVAPVIILSLPNPQALDATIAAITRQHGLPFGNQGRAFRPRAAIADARVVAHFFSVTGLACRFGQAISLPHSGYVAYLRSLSFDSSLMISR